MNKKIDGLLILFILCVLASDVLGNPTVFYGTPSVNGVTVITGTNISLLVNGVYRTSVLANASATPVYQIECPNDTAATDNASFMIENLTAVGWDLCDGLSKSLNISATDNTPPVNTSSISPTSLTYDNSGNVSLSGVGTCSDGGYGMNETGPYRLAYKAMGSSSDTNCNVGGYTNLTWGTSNNISFAGEADNYYCIQLQCQDLAGNIGYYNSSNNVLYDPTAPVVSLVNSSFNTSNTTPSITFNYTDATSSSNNASCTLYFNGVSVAINASVTSNTNTVLTASTQSEGIYSVYVNCTDLAGNVGKSSTTILVGVDNTAPAVNISSPADGAWTNDNTTAITFKFVDAVSPTSSCTIIVNNTAYGTNAAVLNNTDTIINISGSGLADGSGYVLKVNCTDSMGGNLGSSSTQILNIDTLAPTVVVASNVSSLKKGETALVNFTLSESSVNFVADNVTVAGGVLSSWSNVSGTFYTAIFIPTDNSTAAGTVNVSAAEFTDAAGNDNTVSNHLSMAVDTVAPSVVVSLSDTALAAGETAVVTFNFSEAPTDFAVNDVTAANGNLTNFTNTSATIYTVTFTPADNLEDATNVITVGTSWTDAAGNAPVSETNSSNYAIDTKEPTGGVSVGGGGGTTYHPPTETPPQQTIGAGRSGAFNFTNSYVSEIDVTVKDNVTGTFTIANSTQPSGSPFAIASADGAVYNYIEITSTIPNSNIATATIKFKVPKTWVSAENIDHNTIALKKLVNNVWVEYPTTQTTEDASYYYYETTVSSFSRYVIVGAFKTTTPVILTPTAEENITPTTEENITPSTEENITHFKPTTKVNKLLIFGIIVGVVALVAVLLFFSLTRKGKRLTRKRSLTRKRKNSQF